MNIIGMEVEHKKFGKGKVLSVIEDKVEVDFKSTIKVFLYPDSFEKFFIINNHKAKEFLDTKIDEINEVKKLEKAEKDKIIESHTNKEGALNKANAVFALHDDDWAEVIENWKITTGKYTARSSKGQPRIPRNLSIGSACLLTMKPDGGLESDRIITGIFMVEEKFVGSQCVTGVIQAHKKYRIIWESEREDILFWNYFAEESRLSKWGNSKMKYLPDTIIQKILEDMIKSTIGDEKQGSIEDFYYYFRHLNDL